MFDPEGKGHHGHEGISAFWKLAIEPIAKFEFTIIESLANPGSNTCANLGSIKTSFADGSYTVTDLVMVYVVNDDGTVASMKAYWEPDRTMASFTASPGASRSRPDPRARRRRGRRPPTGLGRPR